jgi:hypothetical protein
MVKGIPVPLAIVQRLAKAMPNCQAKILPGEGPYLLFTCWESILTTFLS